MTALAGAFLALAVSSPAFAQKTNLPDVGTVKVTVTGVHSNKGVILATLCDDPKAQFPGGCMAYSAMMNARQGDTVITFDSVRPGIYALQMFHDEDGSYTPNIPPEGFAFGNDQQYPPTFEKASYKIAGDAALTVKMVYQAMPTSAPQGQKGAPAPAGVTKIDVRDDGLYGAFYLPKSDKPVPALLVLGGSEGGLQASSGVGSTFSTKGYAVLALAYFQEQGLPQTLENIPLEYFDKAVAWLKKQPGVDPNAIGVVGGSRGSEAALLLAARNANIKAVLAFAPSNVAWQGLNFANPMNMGPAWTVAGKPIPFIIPDPMKYRPGGAMIEMFRSTLAKPFDPAAEIPVEQIRGPVLLISGKADALWPSYEMGEAIVKRLKAKGFKHGVQHLSYDSGHMVFMGDPTTGSAISMSKAPPSPMLGGTGEAGLAAWTDNWPKALAFFDKALKGKQR
jgi:dienelactone hydrolase/uncharacterized protein (DUF2141 family)